MFPLITGLMSGGLSLLGSVFSSQTSAQNTQQQIAAQGAFQKESEEFNAAEAQKNRDYQTQMSNTAFQRSRADAQAAGLNPMVLAGMGGASTPSGSTASVGTPSVPMPQTTHALSRIGDAVDRAVSSAIAAKTYDKMSEETANLITERAKTKAVTDLVRQERETEVGRSEEAAARGTTAVYGITAARQAAREAAAKERSLPDWLLNIGETAKYTGNAAGAVTSPFMDLVSSASGVGRLKLAKEAFEEAKRPKRSTTEKSFSDTRGYGSSTFEERFHY